MKLIAYIAVISSMIFGGQAFAQSNIDPSYQYSWGENIGWLNWYDANGGIDGVQVLTTYLSGYIWGENIGWINVGDGAPANGVSYANVDGTDFGINLDEINGDLSGYAWGENIGWINFDTSILGVDRARYDLCTPSFYGYAWGENVGWINLADLRTIYEDCNNNNVPDECETDTDEDGVIDDCENCPNDPNKTEPGQCGCGYPDTDSDGDGVANCNDDCPGTPPGTPVDNRGCPIPCDPPTIVSAESVMDHRDKGPFGIALTTDPATAKIEMRHDELKWEPGPSRIVVTFDCDIQCIDGTCDPNDEVTLSSGTINSLTIVNDRELHIDLQDTAKNSCLKVTLNGIACVFDGSCVVADPESVLPPTDLYIRVILGDVNEDGIVSIFDLGLIKSQLGKPLTGNNFKKDVRADGIITIFDLGEAKSNLMKQPPGGVKCP